MTKHEKNAIKLLSAITPKRTTLTILQKAFLKNGIIVTDNLDERVEIRAKMFAEADGPLLLDLKRFAACGSISACSMVESVNEYPRSQYVPTLDREMQIYTNPVELISMLAQCAPYASDEESRACLCSVYADAKRSTVFATDGHRAFFINSKEIGKVKEGIMFPAAVVRRLNKIAEMFEVRYLNVMQIKRENSEWREDLSKEEKKKIPQFIYRHFVQCQFTGIDVSGDYQALLHSAEDTYPPWPRVVPNFDDDGRVITRLSNDQLQKLIGGIESLIPFTNLKTFLIRLRGPNEILVYNRDIDEVVRFVKFSFPVFPETRKDKVTKDDQEVIVDSQWEIGINSKYFVQLLKEFSEEKELSFSWDVGTICHLTAKVMRSGERTGLIMPLKICYEPGDVIDLSDKERIEIGNPTAELAS